MVRIARNADEEFACPHCATGYRVTWSLPARDSGSATCEVCDRMMVKWTDSAIPTYRMKMPAADSQRPVWAERSSPSPRVDLSACHKIVVIHHRGDHDDHDDRH